MESPSRRIALGDLPTDLSRPSGGTAHSAGISNTRQSMRTNNARSLSPMETNMPTSRTSRTARSAGGSSIQTSRKSQILNSARSARVKDMAWAKSVSRLANRGADGRTVAYRLFARIDCDGDGKITVWELERYLCKIVGVPMRESFQKTFESPAAINLQVCMGKRPSDGTLVAGWADDASAEHVVCLFKGLRVLAVNEVTLHIGKESLAHFNQLLQSLPHDDPITITFQNPDHIIGESDAWLDFKIQEQPLSVQLPEGVYNTREAFAEAVTVAVKAEGMTTLRGESQRAVSYFACTCGGEGDASKGEYYTMTFDAHPFQILWSSGPNSDESSILHFGGDPLSLVDTPETYSYATQHYTGTMPDPMGGERRLILLEGGLQKLCTDLAQKFDSGGGTVLDFDEFLLLYETYLTPGQARQRLKDLVLTGYINERIRQLYREIREASAAAESRKAGMMQRREKNKTIARKQIHTATQSGEYAHTRDGLLSRLVRRKFVSLATKTVTTSEETTYTNTNTGGMMNSGIFNFMTMKHAHTHVDAHDDTYISAHNFDRTKAAAYVSGADLSEIEQRSEVLRKTREEQRQWRKHQTAKKREHLRTFTRVDRQTKASANLATQMSSQFALKQRLASCNLTEEHSKLTPPPPGAESASSNVAPVIGSKFTSVPQHLPTSVECLHPSFAGYYRIKKEKEWDPEFISPVFFGCVVSEAKYLPRKVVMCAVRSLAKEAGQGTLIGGPKLCLSPPKATRKSSTRHSLSATFTPTSTKHTTDVQDIHLHSKNTIHGNGSTVESVKFIQDTQDPEDSLQDIYDDVGESERRLSEGAGWRTYPLAPVCTGDIRLQLFSVARRYDTGELIHPALFGYSRLKTQKGAEKAPDSSLITPVMMGYDLVRRFVQAGEYVFGTVKPALALAQLKDGDMCPICLIRQPGCPLCWEFPDGWLPSDFAYEGPNGKKKQQDEVDEGKPAMHTDMTTVQAIRLYRTVSQSAVHFYIKTIPCGPVTELTLGSDYPVHVLYSMFRAASAEGFKHEAFLFLPTVEGTYSLDNENEPETDIRLGKDTGNLPLSKYNLCGNKSSICLLHTSFFSAIKTSENIRLYLEYEVRIEGHKQINEIYNHLDKCPAHPHHDPVQVALVQLMVCRTQQQRQQRVEDSAEEYRVHDALLKEAENVRKTHALDLKRNARIQEKTVDLSPMSSTRGASIPRISPLRLPKA